MIRCHGIGTAKLWRNGEIVQEVSAPNLVTDEGFNYALDVWAGGAAKESNWYLVPLNVDHTPAAGDTYALSMGTGYESTDYFEPSRQVWAPGAVSGQSVDNSAAPAEYTMAGNDPAIYGMALVSHSTGGDTDATGAVLFSIISLALPITGIAGGDSLELQYTATASSTITDGFCIHNEGLDNFLSVALCGGTQYDPLYLAPLAADYSQDASDAYGDVMGTGNAESDDYSETVRQAWQCGAISAKALTNSGNPATVTLAGNDTLYGHALVSDDTKGGTTGGILVASYKYDTAKTVAMADTVLKMILSLGAPS